MVDLFGIRWLQWLIGVIVYPSVTMHFSSSALLPTQHGEKLEGKFGLELNYDILI